MDLLKAKRPNPACLGATSIKNWLSLNDACKHWKANWNTWHGMIKVLNQTAGLSFPNIFTKSQRKLIDTVVFFVNDKFNWLDISESCLILCLGISCQGQVQLTWHHWTEILFNDVKSMPLHDTWKEKMPACVHASEQRWKNTNKLTMSCEAVPLTMTLTTIAISTWVRKWHVLQKRIFFGRLTRWIHPIMQVRSDQNCMKEMMVRHKRARTRSHKPLWEKPVTLGKGPHLSPKASSSWPCHVFQQLFGKRTLGDKHTTTQRHDLFYVHFILQQKKADTVWQIIAQQNHPPWSPAT